MIPARLARFVVAGAVGFVVDAGVLYAALFAGAGWYSGRVASFFAAVVVTWLINRRWTFTARSAEPAAAEFARYLGAMALGGVANYLTYGLFGIAFPRTMWLPLVAVAAGSVVGLAVNFTTASSWVYRGR